MITNNGQSTINNETLSGISDFINIDTKENMLENIDRIIEINIKDGFVVKYDLYGEIGLLYDVKRLVKALPY